MPKQDSPSAPTSATLTQRDREFLAEFLDAMCKDLLRDGPITLRSVTKVSTALKLDVDGVWVDLAAQEATAADTWLEGPS